MLRSVRPLIQKRLFSASTLSTKEVLVQNFLHLNNVARAKNEEALEKALSASGSYDVHNLPNEFVGLKDYLATSETAASGPYKEDPTHWQNASLFEYLKIESTREETYPFMIGGAVTFLFFCVYFPTLFSEDMKQKSEYAQLVEACRGGNKAHAHH